MRTFWLKHRVTFLYVFVLSNLAFLAVDIYFAHSINQVRLRMEHSVPYAEWIPFIFSLTGPILIAAGLWLLSLPGETQRRIGQVLMAVTGGLAVLVGVAGMFFHLDSQFFHRMDVRSLVYTAPFMAPLSYAGLGFLLLLNVKVDAAGREWGQWIVFFALGGFFGNFILAVCDHAQNGFFYASEWIPVVAAALAVGFLAVPLIIDVGQRFYRSCLAVMGLQVAVGLLGFAFHFQANFHSFSAKMFTDFIFGAPIFAPLLYADIAALAVFGIYDLMLKGQPEHAREA